MKKLQNLNWILVTGVIAGVFTLLTFFTNQPALMTVRAFFLRWLVLVSAALLFFAVFDFILVQIRGLGSHEGGFLNHLAALCGFSAMFILGLAKLESRQQAEWMLGKMQTAFESTLAALICLALLYGLYRISFERRGRIVTAFLISALFFLIIFSGILSFLPIPPVIAKGIEWVQALPVGGMYGLLIGMAIGALVTGVRIIFLGENPFRGHNE